MAVYKLMCLEEVQVGGSGNAVSGDDWVSVDGWGCEDCLGYEDGWGLVGDLGCKDGWPPVAAAVAPPVQVFVGYVGSEGEQDSGYG